MKRTAFIVTVVLLVSPQAFAGTWTQSLVTAQQKAKQSRQLIFVDLFANWCGWCHKMEQEVFPSEAFQKETNDMVLLRLNTEDGGEGTKLAAQYSVTSLPTFLVLNSDGAIAGMIRGYSPANQFVAQLKDVEDKYREFEKFAASEPTFATDYAKRLELAKSFRERFAFGPAESRFKKLIAELKAPVDIRAKSYLELALTQALQQHYDEATRTIKGLATLQTSGETYERSRILQAQIFYQQGNIMGAANELRTFKAKFPKSPLISTVDMMLPQVDHSARK